MSERDPEMEMKHYLEIFNRRKWIVVITAVATLLVVSMATFLMTPTYSASTTIRIAQIQDQSVSYFDLNYTQRLINTYVELVQSRPFLQQAIEHLQLSADPKDLAESVTVVSIPNTELLVIAAESHDPRTAMLISNTLGQLLVEEGAKLYSGQGKSSREILLDQLTALESTLNEDRNRLQALLASEGTESRSSEAQDLTSRIFVQEQTYSTLLDAYEEARLLDEARANSVSIAIPAEVPGAPSNPRVALNLVLGSLVGIAGGIGLALVLENLDTSIYSPDDLHVEGQAPLLGSIPKLKVPTELRAAPLLLKPNGKSSAAEAFRLLRSSVLTREFGRPLRTLLVTSVEPDAGKSTVLTNLAVALAESGRSVVVVDCDLRKPSLDRVFSVANSPGLKDVIANEREIGDVLVKTKFAKVHVLPSGGLTNNPSELLGLPRMQQVIRDLANWADIVLIDSPPLLQFSDAVTLAPLVDGVALVVSRGRVTGAQVERALAQLAKVGAEQLGIVFNRAETKQAAY